MPNTDDMPDYNPRSMDSSFTKLFGRMDAQDAMLSRIEGQLTVQNGRVGSLERDKWLNRGMAGSGFLSACHHILLQLLGK